VVISVVSFVHPAALLWYGVLPKTVFRQFPPSMHMSFPEVTFILPFT